MNPAFETQLKEHIYYDQQRKSWRAVLTVPVYPSFSRVEQPLGWYPSKEEAQYALFEYLLTCHKDKTTDWPIRCKNMQLIAAHLQLIYTTKCLQEKERTIETLREAMDFKEQHINNLTEDCDHLRREAADLMFDGVWKKMSPVRVDESERAGIASEDESEEQVQKKGEHVPTPMLEQKPKADAGDPADGHESGWSTNVGGADY